MSPFEGQKLRGVTPWPAPGRGRRTDIDRYAQVDALLALFWRAHPAGTWGAACAFAIEQVRECDGGCPDRTAEYVKARFQPRWRALRAAAADDGCGLWSDAWLVQAAWPREVVQDDQPAPEVVEAMLARVAAAPARGRVGRPPKG